MNKLLIVVLLCITTGLTAMSSKPHEPIEVIKGESSGHYSKPGAAVEIKYTTEHVGVGEISHISAKLLTKQTSGTMDIDLHADRRLNQITTIPENISVDLSTISGEYPFSFNVSADSDGIYYIKLLVKIQSKFRAFSIPVYIGDKKSFRKISKQLKQDSKGEKIIITPASETLK